MRRALALALAAVALAACRPDLPDRRCDAPDDCFPDERCLARTCVSRALLPDAAASAPDAAGDPDGGPADPADGSPGDAAVDTGTGADAAASE